MVCRNSIFALLLVLLNLLSGTSQVSVIKPRTLSSTRLKNLAASIDYDGFNDLLRPILRSRVPGTNGHHAVKQYLVKFFSDLGWQVTLDEFDKDTVIGPKRFTNMIATANPNAKKFVLLTAHYDSKLMNNSQNKEFLAATDSAVPCAMIMSIAKNLDLAKLKKNNDYTLQVVLFDGEEAFISWTADDSIYGSTHLAEIWSKPDENNNSHLSKIEFLTLLDLIGEKNPKFYSGFPKTHRYFERLVYIEKRLVKDGSISPTFQNSNEKKQYFVEGLLSESLGIEDDHIPFLRKGRL
ncbi:glutaminyl-peptide cyclotransferase-like [Dendronephthya gigantea]|uniref:glutaminyl-peptide cyclotransferase-like n=1 Tax=Dendronephthya gigantea TaxID=151771 RepID=UPI00106B5483|nr:glutaminyl-peptide cyclotransferase-like [Dendronephthya gigantea]